MRLIYLLLLAADYVALQCPGVHSSIKNKADDGLDDVQETNQQNDLSNQFDDFLLRLTPWTSESTLASLPFSKKRNGENFRNETKANIVSSSDMEEAFLTFLVSNDFSSIIESKRSERQQPQDTTQENKTMKLLLSTLASRSNDSKEHHRSNSRRDRNVASRNQWMNLHRRRRHHSLHRRYTQWKTEQKNFLMNNHDESIFGKLEYQTCQTCQLNLGEMNVQLIQEQINQLDEELKDVNFTQSMFQPMNNSIHQLFSSNYIGSVNTCHL
jgi:hypothetical protein